MEALARYGKLNPRQVEVITIQPNSWNTQSLLDWMSILQRVPSIPEQAKRLAEAEQIPARPLNLSRHPSRLLHRKR